MNALRLYQNAYRKRPLLTHALETGIIMASADVISQLMVEDKSLMSFDAWRSLRFGGLGVCFVAPTRVAWYKILESKFPGYTASTVFQKVALDQMCFAPPFVFVLVSSVSFANGKHADEVFLKLKSSYTDIIFNNWKVWPCVQLCNFYMVPVHLRMSTVQLFSLIWNVYLSWKTNLNKSIVS